MSHEVLSPAKFSGSELPSDRFSLNGSRVKLEPIHITHLEQLSTTMKIGKEEYDCLWRYLSYGPFVSAEEFRRHCTQWINHNAESQNGIFYAIIKSTAANNAQSLAVGFCAYLDVRPKDGSIELGHFVFSPELQKTREATEVVYLLLQHAFEILKYRRVVWRCNAENEKSSKAALRYGFKYEGTWRNAAVIKGRNRDTAWYSIIDSEWSHVKMAFENWLDGSNFDENGQQRRKLSELFVEETHL